MTVLLLGRNPRIVTKVVAAISAAGHSAEGMTTDEAALARIAEGDVSALILGGGVEPPSREKLLAAANAKGVTIVQGPHIGDRDADEYVRAEVIPRL
ncbi:hypothetical protein ACFWY9_27675 [Amycolatopsis sp. NPDC059027]|uniref:hypothetical protein n=1 Tax=unclassified Amycolatopsis TaxID=2618356 RepID=UPI003671885F